MARGRERKERYEERLLRETQAKNAVQRSPSGPTMKNDDKGPEAGRKEVERPSVSSAKRGSGKQ